MVLLALSLNYAVEDSPPHITQNVWIRAVEKRRPGSFRASISFSSGVILWYICSVVISYFKTSPILLASLSTICSGVRAPTAMD